MKKGILIDVYNREVREVKIGDEYTEISKMIGCDLFDLVSIDEINDIFVDDEGLLHLTNDSMFFQHKSYPNPLSGNGLILGHNEEGESVDTTLTVEQVKRDVEFYTIFEVQSMFS